MNARILPLKGKYYGTEIEVVSDGGFEYTINLWNCANYRPSPIELASSGDFGTSEEYWREHDGAADGHFESLETYETAKKIAELIMTNGPSLDELIMKPRKDK